MKIHFIGIGGIGVSALAQYYLAKGHKTSGSDLIASEITDFLTAKGVKISIGNKKEHIASSIDLVIHSPAVKQDNPEYREAQRLGLQLKSYPEALGELTEHYITIAVAGSHGKSTTTAMIGLLMQKAGLDPTVIVGTKLKEFGGSNFLMGQGKYLVIEACEYDGSFLEYSPHIEIITNVDKEHLDYFKTFGGVKKAFRNFIVRLPVDGWLVYNKDDKSISPSKRAIGYSLRQKEAKKLHLQIPGKHNVSNALASLATARILGIRDEVSFASLNEYKGSWRRFEIIKNTPYTVVSDYGHHPNEILATLTATREKYPKNRIFCIFQPHQYQRTYYLFKDFVKIFRKVKIDQIIITDIYDVAGREEKNINEKISSKILAGKINKKNIRYMPTKDAEKFVKENIQNGDVLIIMGAGDVYKLADNF